MLFIAGLLPVVGLEDSFCSHISPWTGIGLLAENRLGTVETTGKMGKGHAFTGIKAGLHTAIEPSPRVRDMGKRDGRLRNIARRRGGRGRRRERCREGCITLGGRGGFLNAQHQQVLILWLANVYMPPDEKPWHIRRRDGILHVLPAVGPESRNEMRAQGPEGRGLQERFHPRVVAIRRCSETVCRIEREGPILVRQRCRIIKQI